MDENYQQKFEEKLKLEISKIYLATKDKFDIFNANNSVDIDVICKVLYVWGNSYCDYYNIYKKIIATPISNVLYIGAFCGQGSYILSQMLGDKYKMEVIDDIGEYDKIKVVDILDGDDEECLKQCKKMFEKYEPDDEFVKNAFVHGKVIQKIRHKILDGLNIIQFEKRFAIEDLKNIVNLYGDTFVVTDIFAYKENWKLIYPLLICIEKMDKKISILFSLDAEKYDSVFAIIKHLIPKNLKMECNWEEKQHKIFQILVTKD